MTKQSLQTKTTFTTTTTTEITNNNVSSNNNNNNNNNNVSTNNGSNNNEIRNDGLGLSQKMIYREIDQKTYLTTIVTTSTTASTAATAATAAAAATGSGVNQFSPTKPHQPPPSSSSPVSMAFMRKTDDGSSSSGGNNSLPTTVHPTGGGGSGGIGVSVNGASGGNNVNGTISTNPPFSDNFPTPAALEYDEIIRGYQSFTHYTKNDLKNMGRDIVRAIYYYANLGTLYPMLLI